MAFHAYRIMAPGRSLRWIALLAGLVGALSVGYVCCRSGLPAAPASRPPPLPVRRPPLHVPARPPLRPASPTGDLPRAEVIGIVRTFYRQELLKRELDLEQQRYGEAYWEADQDGRVLAGIRDARAQLASDLSAEANDVLAALLPGDVDDDRVRLTSFFDDDHPGPNLRFLSESSRRQFVSEVLAQNWVDQSQLAAAADRTLSRAERELYHVWNDTAPAALREQLVAFHPGEREFLIVLAASGHAEESDTRALLEAQLGSDRYRELREVTAPSTATAVHDLRRAGLPVTSASWLASVRQAASDAVRQVWQDGSIPERSKPSRAAQVEAAYTRMIATTLSVPVRSLDELPLPP
jgi:hypothetical protein